LQAGAADRIGRLTNTIHSKSESDLEWVTSPHATPLGFDDTFHYYSNPDTDFDATVIIRLEPKDILTTLNLNVT
jgi:hypothetical protein